jgi:hypothetical protein
LLLANRPKITQSIRDQLKTKEKQVNWAAPFPPRRNDLFHHGAIMHEMKFGFNPPTRVFPPIRGVGQIIQINVSPIMERFIGFYGNSVARLRRVSFCLFFVK